MNRMKLQQGAGLIEILITILITAIGLLGLAVMQTLGMINTQSSYYRSQATILASEYADILRSNQVQLKQDKFGDSADDGTDWSTAASVYSKIADCSSLVGCSDIERAESDLANWSEKVQSTLANGRADVERVGDVYHLTISWLDDRRDQDSDNNTSKNFITSFQP